MPQKNGLARRPLTNDEIKADRSRAIDQLKRLYAVVMGYSVLNLINNLYAGITRGGINPLDFSNFLVIAAYVIPFTSLVSLLYLRKERGLDIQYLRPWSRAPGRFSLFMDFLSLGASAGLFVLLSDTLPAAGDVHSVQDLITNERRFCNTLIFINVVDSIFLIINVIRIAIDRPIDWARIKMNGWWILLNSLAIAAICFALYLSDVKDKIVEILGYVFSVNIVAALLVGSHALRFGFDFYLTYQFYYPSDDLSFRDVEVDE